MGSAIYMPLLNGGRKVVRSNIPGLRKQGAIIVAQLVNYRDEFREGARRFDMGEYSGFINLPMAKQALGQILEWG